MWQIDEPIAVEVLEVKARDRTYRRGVVDLCRVRPPIAAAHDYLHARPAFEEDQIRSAVAVHVGERGRVREVDRAPGWRQGPEGGRADPAPAGLRPIP